MRDEYNFSKSIKNLYIKQVKHTQNNTAIKQYDNQKYLSTEEELKSKLERDNLGESR